MLENIKGIRGYAKERPRTVTFMATRGTKWIKVYLHMVNYYEQDRRRHDWNTDANWFLVLQDDTELPLPPPEEIVELKSQIDDQVEAFWQRELSIPE